MVFEGVKREDERDRVGDETASLGQGGRGSILLSTKSRTNQELLDATSEVFFSFQLHGSASMTGTVAGTSWEELGLFVECCGDDTQREIEGRLRSSTVQHGTATVLEFDSLDN